VYTQLVKALIKEGKGSDVFIASDGRAAIVISRPISIESGFSQVSFLELSEDNWPNTGKLSEEELLEKAVELHHKFSPGVLFDIKLAEIRMWDFERQDWV